jgi:hypothetical protein
MSDRQESSVMASIQDILRDAQVREEEEKLAVQRHAEEEERARLEGARLAQEAAEARLRAEEEERQRRAHDEQRRQVELAALHEATITTAKIDAEAQARLAEIAKQQEHERHLAVVRNDAGKKRITAIAGGVGVLAVLMAVGAGVAVKKASDEKVRIEREIADLRGQADKAEADAKRLRAERDNTKDPEKIAELERRLKKAEEDARQVAGRLGERGVRPPVAGGPPVGGGAPVPAKPPAPKCPPGDPMCG